MTTRREFLERTAAAGMIAAAGRAGLTMVSDRGWIGTGRRVRDYTLTASVGRWDVGGGATAAWMFNGQLPGPELRATEGDLLRITLRNDLPEPTTIHWHGIPLPFRMDGVPELTQSPVPPGGTFTYEYIARVPGTYWYHSHFSYQFERGLFGALVIEPRTEPLAYDQSVTLVLDDWLTDFENQRASAQPYNMVLGDVVLGAIDVPMTDLAGTQDSDVSASPRRGPSDGAHAAHSDPRREPVFDCFTINGRSGAAIPEIAVGRGDRVRFRFVNASTASVYPLYLAGHRFTITHLDGQPITPFETDLVVVGMGERVDAMVTAVNPGAWRLTSVDRRHQSKGLGVTVRYRGTRPDTPVIDGPAPRMRAQPYRGMSGLDVVEPRGVDRTYTLDLRMDGPMSWTINERRYPETSRIIVKRGERIQLAITNNSMFAHPIHLHGHFFDVVRPYGDPRPARTPLRKDTIVMYHMEHHVVEFTADNPGPRWFLHCHNQYHHMGGMATEVVYE